LIIFLQSTKHLNSLHEPLFGQRCARCLAKRYLSAFGLQKPSTVFRAVATTYRHQLCIKVYLNKKNCSYAAIRYLKK
ncbi:hypothetical protein, partial [Pseudomonas sp. K2]|uniref:hypothetical protein n=1 Tax=Pseudomonas sp. K2 TaxID=212119 RepID=UPI001D02E4DE